MIIVTEEVNLDGTELAELDTFLKGRTGRRVIQALAALRPKIASDSHQSGKAAGYEEAIVNLFSLARTVVAPVEDKVSNYPDLDDDKAWAESIPAKQ
jgi:hypothetical protein